ncbi:MAG: Nif3-like dinuclear metal center hexameric protein [Clostridia bacterium]|nr:Nif3-like dinuclear metal center hexameric protein [Clostridia bacterium]
MTVQEIFELLNAFAPVERAEEYDNPGLLVGDGGAEVRRILVALDPSMRVVEEARERGADIIVTHHPFPFTGMKRFVCGDPAADKLSLLLKSGISLIAMHTNLDRAAGGVNDALAETLGLNGIAPAEESGLIRKGELGESIAPEEFCREVKAKLCAPGVRAVCGSRPIRRVWVGGGSCSEFLAAAVRGGADAFVTADCRHHAFLDAEEWGITLVDAGHFATEAVVLPRLRKLLAPSGAEILASESDRDPVIHF